METIFEKYDSKKWNPTTKPEVVFPFTKTFAGKNYTQSLDTPTYVRHCTKERAYDTAARLRKEGWAARVVKYMTPMGIFYLAYERLTGREMRPKKGHKRLY